MNIPHKIRRSKSYKNKTLGQGLVEFSLILPMLLFILLGIIDYGRILLVFSSASNATRNATRQGTLVGNITDATMGDVPRYMACATIGDYANNVFGANIDQVDILYFNTPLDATAADSATTSAALQALDSGDLTTYEPADFSCNDARGGNPVISEGDVTTGDLMVILVSTRIDFITPFLSSLYPSFEITFRSQRTIVESLVLNVNGADRDGDGLLDQYEFERFGCVLKNTDGTDNPVYLMPDNTLLVNVDRDWSYLGAQATNYDADSSPPDAIDTAALNPPELASAAAHDSYRIPGDCATEDISKSIFDSVVTDRADFDAQFGHLQCDAALTPAADEDAKTTYTGCIVIATGLFSSTSDPDEDGCNNGCEEARQTNPFDYFGGYSGADSDGDGLTDAAEIGGGTDPLDPDSDNDGLWDGTERCEFINASDDTICDSSPQLSQYHIDNGLAGYAYFYDPLNPSTNYWSDTDPDDVDSDNDDLEDGFEYASYDPTGTDPDNLDPNDDDTDDDGLKDGREIDGFELDLTINGLTGRETYYTRTGTADTDNDGRSDGEEILGYIVTNDGVDITVQSSPQDQDTDDDGVCDGDGVGDGFCPTLSDGTAVADINPLINDTDRDGLSDFDEQITHETDADNDNTDRVAGLETESATCDLTDTYEMLSDDATTNAATGSPAFDADNDGDVNSNDLTSDTDLISDCDEATIYGSNPYNPDTDGDGYTDDQEIDLANWCLDILRDDSATVLSLPCSGSTIDADGDGYDDGWEAYVFGFSGGDETTYDLSDPTDIATVNALDSDGCDLACEYRNGTRPDMNDTDLDGLNDLYESDTGSSGTSPVVPDSDGDGLIDGREGATGSVCIDPALLNTSTSGTYGASDCYDTYAYAADTDGDGLSDGAEVNGSTTISVDSGAGFVNVVITSDPLLRDTDGDNLTDGEEFNGVSITTTINGTAYTVTVRSNPRSADTDGDGRSDYQETKLNRTYANVYDTDSDGIPDGSHVVGATTILGELPNYLDAITIESYNTNPLDNDTDDDGLTDLQEVTGFDITVRLYDSSNVQVSSNTVTLAGYNPAFPSATSLDPNNQDVDGDGANDGDEVNDTGSTDWVTNPLEANTDGDAAPNDGPDNCPAHDNDDQADADTDGLGDVCDNIIAASYVFVDPMTNVSSLDNSTNWTPSVTVKAVDNLGDAYGGVQITVTFTDPNNGDAIVGTAQTCTTLASGFCSAPLSIPSQLRTLEELDVEVTGFANPPAGLTYDSLRDDSLTIEAPELSVRVSNIATSLVGGSTSSSWSVDSVITVVDDYNVPVQGATVDVVLRSTNGGTVIDSVTCPSVTDVNGQCTVTSNTLTNAYTEAWVSVSGVPNASSLGLVFNPAQTPAQQPAPPPPVAATIHVDTMTNDSATSSSTQWIPSVIVRAVDDLGAARDGVTIEVTFSSGGAQTCVTAVTTGLCTVSAPAQARATTPITATVTNMSNLGGLTYDAGSNVAPLSLNVPDLLVRVQPITGGTASGTNDSWGASADVTVIDEYNTVVNNLAVDVTFSSTTRSRTATETCTPTVGGTCNVVTVAGAFEDEDDSVDVTAVIITPPGSGYAVGGTNDTDNITAPAPIVVAGAFTMELQLEQDQNNNSVFRYRITNTSGTSQSDISTRFYFTTDGQDISLYTLDTYYDQGGATINGPIAHGGNIYYFEFDYGSTTLNNGSSWQWNGRFRTDYNNQYDASNDWWYTGSTNPYAITTYLPVYVNDVLNLGQEPPVPADLAVHVSNIAGNTSGTETAWDASAVVTVIDENGATVNGQTVEVTFSSNNSSATDSDSCTTSGSGTCTVQTTGPAFADVDDSVDMTVDNITATAGYVYDNTNDDGPETIDAPGPIVIAVGDFTMELQLEQDQDNNSVFRYRVTNTSGTSQSDISTRFYFTTDGQDISLYTLDTYYDQGGATINGPIAHGGNVYYFEFDYGSTTLNSGASWQWNGRFRTNWNNLYDASNDWWYTGATNPYAVTTYIPVYISGTLDSGQEP